MRKALAIGALAPALALAAAGASAAPDFASRILFSHNAERSRVGAPAIAWDPALAAGAAAWASYLAATGQFVHSDRKARPGIGENLAMVPGRGDNVEALVGRWSAEQRQFAAAPFPANSRTGNWIHIAHYSQMIWPATSHVGCAIAAGRGNQYLVCRYAPKGNIDGRWMGAPPPR